jgi:type II secretory pathway pseudopilin PulG
MKSEKGFTLIDLLFTCTLIGLICSMAIPGLLRAKGVAQTASAVGMIRVMNSAQLSFAVTCGSGFYAPDLPTLGVPPPAAVQAFLPAELTSSATFLKSGYSFSMTGTALPGAPASCNGLAAGRASPGYVAIADPIDPVGNPHFFGTNADGTIYENATSLASVMPESGPSPEGTVIK